MRSVFRGVALFAVGTMLCAGLVFTADRGIGVSSKKGEQIRATGVGETARPMHPTRIIRVTRDDVMDFLGLGQRSGNTVEGAKADGMIDHARSMMDKGAVAQAIDFMQSTRGFTIPENKLAEYHMLLGDAYTEVGDMALRAAGNFERAARFMDDRDDQIDALGQAAGMYQAAGRTQDVVRVERKTDDIRRGRNTNVVSFGQNAASGLSAVQTIGADDLCTGADPAVLPYTELGMSIDNDPFGVPVAVDADWFSIVTTGPTLLVAETSAPTNEDTRLDLFDNCDAAWTVDLASSGTGNVASNDDFGGTFLSRLEACVAAGTYYLRVGGFADSAAPTGFDLSITSAGTCFIPTPDEFEPDNEVGASFIGCDTLAMEDEEDEDEESESFDDSEDDESSESAGSGKSADSSGSASGGECSGNKVQICHIPPGNPANAHEICVSENAVDAHVNNHGDTLGACEDDGGNGTVCELLQTQCRTIFPEGDIDFVVFNAGAEARRIVVETGASEECGNDPGADDPDTVIALTDAFGSIFAVNDDKGGGSFGSRFEFCAPPNQDFNVAIVGFTELQTFAYELTVDATGPCTLETEANGSCELADEVGEIPLDGTVIEVSGFYTPFLDPFTGSLTPDVDWYHLTLPAGCDDFFAFTNATDVLRSDTFMTFDVPGGFFDGVSPNCPVVPFTSSDDLAANNFLSGVNIGGGGGSDFYISITESPAGPGLPFPYDLELNCVPPPEPDIYEPNDTPATCTPISINTGNTASVHVVGDIDFYCFSLTGDSIVSCETSTPDGGDDTVMEFLNAGNLIACDDDSGAGQFLSEIECCLGDGDYVIGVKDWQGGGGPGNSTIEEYTLLCNDLGPCSADPNPATPVCFTDGDPYTQCPF